MLWHWRGLLQNAKYLPTRESFIWFDWKIKSDLENLTFWHPVIYTFKAFSNGDRMCARVPVPQYRTYIKTQVLACRVAIWICKYMGLYIALYVMCMLSEGGRYDSQIALLFLNAGGGSLHLSCLLLPLSAFLLSHFSGLWRRSCVGTGDVNILSVCWVARLQKKMIIQGKGMVKGRGSAELFGGLERSSSQMKRIIWGKEGVQAYRVKCG